MAEEDPKEVEQDPNLQPEGETEPQPEAEGQAAEAPPELTPEQQQQEQQQEQDRQLWGEAMPEFADEYPNLTPDARQRLLAKRLKALTAERASRTATGTEPSGSVPTDGTEAPPPPVPEAPRFDVSTWRAKAKRAFDEGDGDQLSQALEEPVAYMTALGAMVVKALDEQNRRVSEIDTEVRVPAKFRRALNEVKGATEADIAEAMRVHRSGEAKTPETALKVAVFNRQARQPAKPPEASPAEAARRRAAVAGAGGTPGRRGAPVLRLPETPDEERRLLAEEEA